MFGIGFIVGPALGGVLSAWLGPRMPFVVAGVAALLTAGMSWLLLDETVTREGAEARRARKPRLSAEEVVSNFPLLLILLVAFVGQFGLGMLQSTFALFGDAVLFDGYSEEATNLGIGLLLAVVGVGQFITQTWLLRPLKRRFGDARLVILGTLLRAAALATFASIASPWLGVPGALLFAAGQGLMMPPLQSLATRTAAEAVRGGVLGIYQSSVSLATILSTAVAGVIFSINPVIPYWIGASLSLVVVLPGLILLNLARENRLREA
jgi:predicted MFS family arabinose efflux permease